jgi:hypothetical protein
MRTAKIIALLLPVTLAASCAPVDSTPKPLTEKQSIALAKELDGKIAGKPLNCISDFNGTNLVKVSDDILLYRVSGNLVYKNNLRSSCPGLARDNDIVVSEQFGSQKCRGDIIKLVDRTSGIPGPVCSLGEFVPYRKDKTAG